MISGGRLEVIFPPVAVENAGCMYLDSLPGAVQRRYQWHITADFADDTPQNRHFMGVYVWFALPAATPITPARLDSALAALHPNVEEIGGEPPMPMRTTPAARALAWREAERVHLRLEGNEAIRAFLRPQQDSVEIGWCQRDRWLTSMTVPLLRGPTR